MEILTSDLSLRPELTRTREVGGRVARNRLVMGPLCTMYAAPDGGVTPQLVEYYRARARGGAALIIVELTYIDDISSKSFHAQLGAHSDMMVPGLSDLAEAIKGEGALAGLQIAHCGWMVQKVTMPTHDLSEGTLQTQKTQNGMESLGGFGTSETRVRPQLARLFGTVTKEQENIL